MKLIEQLPSRRVLDAPGVERRPFVLHHRLGIDEERVSKPGRQRIRKADGIAIEIADEIGLGLDQRVGLAEILPHDHRNEGQKNRIDHPDDPNRKSCHLVMGAADRMRHGQMDQDQREDR